MLLAKKQTLEDQIVCALSNNGSQSAENILNAVHQKGKNWSLAATYKALRKLIENGVIVHKQGSYSISQSWIFELSNLIDNYLDTSLSSKHVAHLLPPVGASYSWSYGDLRRLNGFASHLILMAAQVESPVVIYSWSPHLWFNLVQSEDEAKYFSALKKIKVSMIKVIGGDSILDKYTVSLLPQSIVKKIYYANKKFLPQHQYTVVVGDFIITMQIQRQTADAIDALFLRAKSKDQIDLNLFLRIFKFEKTKTLLKIENHKEKANSLIIKFNKIKYDN